MKRKAKNTPIWCDYCNTHISPTGIRGCVRTTCQTKAILKERNEQQWLTTTSTR